MLTAERIINACIWELYRSILVLPVLLSLTWTLVNFLTNDAILESIPSWMMLYNMVHMVRTQQVNFTNNMMQYVWFVLGKILTNDEVHTWQASSHTTWCLGIKRLAGPVSVVFVNRQRTKNLSSPVGTSIVVDPPQSLSQTFSEEIQRKSVWPFRQRFPTWSRLCVGTIYNLLTFQWLLWFSFLHHPSQRIYERRRARSTINACCSTTVSSWSINTCSSQSRNFFSYLLGKCWTASSKVSV